MPKEGTLLVRFLPMISYEVDTFYHSLTLIGFILVEANIMPKMMTIWPIVLAWQNVTN